MRASAFVLASFVALAALACKDESLKDCIEQLGNGPRPLATARDARFEAKVTELSARCRGGEAAVAFLTTPWVDWSNYFGTRDRTSPQDLRGVGGALLDLEYQRLELIAFNLFDNSGTFERYVKGGDGVEGPAVRTWPEMRLPPTHPQFDAVGGAGRDQVCGGALIRGRTLTGICNDIRNPLMGSTGTLFARNVEFEATFPESSGDPLARNRHGDRIGLLVPDPQVVSRKLFTRAQSDAAACADGYGRPDFATSANCDYKSAPFFNVLAGFWIQFMTHDWFSHLEEGHNAPEYMRVGCRSQKVDGVETPLAPEQAAALGCRPDDAIDAAFVAESTAPATFTANGRPYLSRAPKTYRNTNTAWWDVSQIYGYDEASHRRVKRDPKDPARLLLVPIDGRAAAGDRQGYLPLLTDDDPKLPDWAGQESAAFPDNWTVGMSFLHTVFSREHNLFVDEFRRRAAATPDADSGLRDPASPARVIRYADVTPDELYDVARLVVSAEIAKIHTTEWTTQLLYDEPLFKAMNGNWNGLLGQGPMVLPDVLRRTIDELRQAPTAHRANELYSVLASGPGIVGLGSRKPSWSLANPDDVNGGVNHFGSPFNFPEEFISVYRLHPLLPDLLDYREVAAPNAIRAKVPIVETFRRKATPAMRDRGLANWALSLGRQRVGQLALQNHPRFMQNLKIDRLESPTKQIDLAALDLVRDRERGVPRFNEFRRQYGLRQLTSFDDFVDRHVTDPAGVKSQNALVATLREVYGQHRCDASKPITRAQRNPDGSVINDCLGHADGSIVDNVEDVDTVVGYLAETTRPHGFAISETQFVVFILNASRRLFSDRFLTSSFRPEFYTSLGLAWVNHNGPSEMFEPAPVNGHEHQPVSPLKRVLLRTMPELKAELDHVVNAFDPWARDRGAYYSLQWKPRPGAESDEAFRPGR
ncbi:MAG: peroxidase family protein [Vicinamibacterales bacterium]